MLAQNSDFFPHLNIFLPFFPLLLLPVRARADAGRISASNFRCDLSVVPDPLSEDSFFL